MGKKKSSPEVRTLWECLMLARGYFGALMITYTILGVPYGPPNPILIIKARMLTSLTVILIIGNKLDMAS